MKTDAAQRKLEAEIFNEKHSAENKCVKGLRRTLQTLQNTAVEKENLVSGGTPKSMTPNKDKASVSNAKISKKGKNLLKRANVKHTITEEDLTSDGEPSESYWKALAERRRLALEDSLKENEGLHARIALLEEENAQCKILLDETRHLVETLTEMLSEDSPDQDDNKSAVDSE